MNIPTSSSEVSETVYVLQCKIVLMWSDRNVSPSLKLIKGLAKHKGIFERGGNIKWRIIKRTTIEQPLSVEEQQTI